jgi:hypothetical protein
MTAPSTSGWTPARLRLAVLAVASAAVTATLAATVGGTADYVYGAVACLASVVAALFVPAWIVGQVVVALTVAGAIVMEGTDPLLLLPIVTTIIVTTELLAATARLDSPVVTTPRGTLRRIAFSAIAGASVFAIVALVGRLPVPAGLPAIGLAAAACVVLAILLVARSSPEPR